jgi:small subunit ribosomal protein S6
VPTYETIFITSPTLTDEETETTVSMLAGVITDGGGDMIANERMGRRRLAYPINKFDDGVYTKFLYESEGTIPSELDRRGRLADQVLRSLTVRLDKEWAADARVQAALAVQKLIDDKARAIEEAEQKAKDEAEKKIKDAAEAEEAAKEAAEEAVKEAAKAAALAAEAGVALEGEADATTAVDASDSSETIDEPLPTPEAPGTDEAAADSDTPTAESKEEQS